MSENKKTGRPKIILNDKEWSQVEQLGKILCTGEEIAAVLGISYDTLEKRVKEVYELSFTDYIKQFHNTGKASLRRMQYKAASNGNPAMLIWLGKQFLGQTDKHLIADDVKSFDVSYRPKSLRDVTPKKKDE